MTSGTPSGSGTLYALLLFLVIFISGFVLFIQLIPSQAYNPYKNYADSYEPQDFQASSLNTFSYFSNFTLEQGTSETYVFFNDTEIHFAWYTLANLGQNGSLFNIHHFEWSWYIFPTTHTLFSTSGEMYDYIRESPSSERFTARWLLKHYDNATDTATISVGCPHISLKLTFMSNSTSYTLPEALQNLAPLKVQTNWSIDFSQMGSGIWNLLTNILTFQTIKTGVLYLDAILNAFVSLPVWTSIIYIGYRLIAGLIPTVSGGGGA